MAEIREWMTIHKWMTDYTPQTEWIEKRGIMVWIAEVFTAIGSGLYLVSLFYGLVPGYEIFSWWGVVIGWFVIMFLKIPLHIAYFGKPLRFWRTIPPFSDGWKTSWFARGILFNILFGTFVFLQIVSSFLIIWKVVSWDFLPALDILFKVFGCITALLVGTYSGFIMNYVKGIQFWNSALLPLVLMLGGVLDGFAVLMGLGMTPVGATIDAHTLELLSSIFLVVNILILAVYLLSATYVGAAAKLSVTQLIKGKVALVFWIGLIVLGMLVPLAISLPPLLFKGVSGSLWLIIAIVSHTVGAFALKYCLLKVGIYKPLFIVNVCA
jgi:formate-dependent nitrite reductase membrane component NrfD